jgi:dTDP-4-dehydrorhamnose 3,5-epimerase
MMQVERFEIRDILLLIPAKHEDQRGFFSETFRADLMVRCGIQSPFVQDNHVFSKQRGVLRGLHFQMPPLSQGKLVRCTRGAILDVAVDIRLNSPTYGNHVAVELSAQNWQQLWIPSGFAHGYITLQDNCEVIYKVTEYYAPEYDRGIAWNDPALKIDWRLPSTDIILSDKDQRQPTLAESKITFKL